MARSVCVVRAAAVEVAFLFCVGAGVRLGVRDIVPVGAGEAVEVAVRVKLEVPCGDDVAVAVLVAV